MYQFSVQTVKDQGYAYATLGGRPHNVGTGPTTYRRHIHTVLAFMLNVVRCPLSDTVG